MGCDVPVAQIIQCRFCNKPFQSYGGFACHNCLTQIEEDFGKIKSYLYDNPQKDSVEEIAEGTGVQKKIILHLLKENRMSVKAQEDSALVCEICRKPIMNGRICLECKGELSNKLAGALPPEIKEKDKEALKKGKSGSKMHVDIRAKNK